jgi:hypothetical protein
MNWSGCREGGREQAQAQEGRQGGALGKGETEMGGWGGRDLRYALNSGPIGARQASLPRLRASLLPRRLLRRAYRHVHVVHGARVLRRAERRHPGRATWASVPGEFPTISTLGQGGTREGAASVEDAAGRKSAAVEWGLGAAAVCT